MPLHHITWWLTSSSSVLLLIWGWITCSNTSHVTWSAQLNEVTCACISLIGLIGRGVTWFDHVTQLSPSTITWPEPTNGYWNPQLTYREKRLMYFWLSDHTNHVLCIFCYRTSQITYRGNPLSVAVLHHVIEFLDRRTSVTWHALAVYSFTWCQGLSRDILLSHYFIRCGRSRDYIPRQGPVQCACLFG